MWWAMVSIMKLDSAITSNRVLMKSNGVYLLYGWHEVFS